MIHILINTRYCKTFILLTNFMDINLMDINITTKYLFVVLFCISLINSEIEHLIKVYWSFGSPFVNFLFISFL